MGHGKSEPRQIVGSGVINLRGDVVQFVGRRRREVTRPFLVLDDCHAPHSHAKQESSFLRRACIGCCRTAWRTASASIGAVLVRSSPSTNTASANSTSWKEGSGPDHAAIFGVPSLPIGNPGADAPVEPLRSNQRRKAKLDSSDARGEPMPMTFFCPSASAAAPQRFVFADGSERYSRRSAEAAPDEDAARCSRTRIRPGRGHRGSSR